MVKVLEIDGKKLHSIKAATSLVSYSADYITRLAREQKIVAGQVGRQWYIDVESLKHYESVMALEQTIRKQKLSEERKLERTLVEEVAEKNKQRHQRNRLHAARTKVVVSAALVAGLFSGYLLENSLTQLTTPQVQVASSKSASSVAFLGNEVEEAVPVSSTLATSSEVAANMYVPEFVSGAVDIKSFASSTQGVLLLPSSLTAGELVQLQDLFSDRIVVRTDATGQKFVGQVNGQSEIIGNEIPVIMVPLNQPRS